MTYQAVPFTTTFSNAPNLDFKVTQFIDALDVLCAQLTRGLFAIAKFLEGLPIIISIVNLPLITLCIRRNYVTIRFSKAHSTQHVLSLKPTVRTVRRIQPSRPVTKYEIVYE